MKALKIEGSSDIPQVVFDDKQGKLFMGGSSLPENVIEFFNPIMQWLDEYKNNRSISTTVEFNFEYLNTASTNMMARIIESLQDLNSSDNNFSITWCYTTGDYDMKELGMELLEDTGCTYNIVEVKG
jgi:hypothetical protein